MRDILVTVIFVGGLIMTIRRPYVAAMLWVWIGLMNPHRLSWGFAYDLPFGLIAAAALFFSIVINPGKASWPKGGAVFLLILLTAWMSITTYAAISPDESLPKYINVMKVMLMSLAVASVIRTRDEIVGMVILMAASISFFGIKGGIFTVLSGGSFIVWGPPSSVIEGNNELAVAVIITVPLLYYLSTQLALIKELLPVIRKVPDYWMKAGLYAAIFLCLIAALGSQSRGALLAMISMGAVLWWRSKSRLALAVMIALMCAVALVFMPETWMGRMNTIATYDQDASAMGRINAWTMAINIANDRILGAGFATDLPWIYQRYAPNPDFVIVAHSIYFQILGEHGYIGLFLYLGFWFLTYRLANRITKLTAGNKDLQWANMLGAMSKVSLIGFAVGGMFLSLAYWDMPFYIMVILLCTERLLGTPVAQTASVRAVADPIPEAASTSNRPREGSTGAIPSNNNGR